MIHDRPTATELMDAVQHFLETELRPLIDDDRLRFRLLIALNALGVVRREIELSTEEDRALDATALLRRVRENERSVELFGMLKNHVAAKLEVVNPGYLARYSTKGEGESTVDLDEARPR